jgi:hypothetical protein
MRSDRKYGASYIGERLPLSPPFLASWQRDARLWIMFPQAPIRTIHQYHDYRRNNINDYESCIFFESYVSLTSGMSGACFRLRHCCNIDGRAICSSRVCERTGVFAPSVRGFDFGTPSFQNQMPAPLLIDTEDIGRRRLYARFRPYLQVIYTALYCVYRFRASVRFSLRRKLMLARVAP